MLRALHSLPLILIVVILFAFQAVAGAHDEFIANLSGAQEVPPVDTEASGEAGFEFDDGTVEFELKLRNIVGVTAAHIHLGAAGENGPIVAFLFESADGRDFGRGEIERSLTEEGVTPQEDLGFDGTLAALMARMQEGTAYVNVHTLAHPDGEIRGQIRPGEDEDDDDEDDDDEDDDDEDDDEKFVAGLSGAQEVPPVETEASGKAEFEFDFDDGTVEFELKPRDIAGVTAAHIHLGAAGENGPIVAFLFESADGIDFRRGKIEGEFTENDIIPQEDLGFDGTVAALAARMREGAAYVNVHTVAHPDGEIRGQIRPENEEFEAELDGAQEVPPVDTEASGEAEFEVEEDGTIEFELEPENIAGVTAAHIHLGAAGENGPIVAVLFENADGMDFHRGEIEGELTEEDIIPREDLGFDGTVAALVARMREGTVYVNVHTLAHPDGEIRGQIHPEEDRARIPASRKSRLSPPEGAPFPNARGEVVINPVFFMVKAIRLPAGVYPVLLDLDDGTGVKVEIGEIPIHERNHDDDDDGDDEEDEEEEFETELEGAQEVPPVETNAFGEAEFEVEDGVIEFEVEPKNIPGVTAAHIHLGAAGENGPIVAVLFENADGMDFHRGRGRRHVEIEGVLGEGDIIPQEDLGFDGTVAALVARMREGMAYVNVHTVAHPDGEIRGQISPERKGSGKLKLRGDDLPFGVASPAELQGRPICVTTANGTPVLSGVTPAPVRLPEPPDRGIEVEPLLLDFGGVLVGNSRTLAVTMRNAGQVSASVTNVFFGPETSAEFTIVGNPPIGALPPGAMATLRVNYAPLDLGPDSGTIVILSDDERTVVVRLSGEGAQVGLPVIRVSPTEFSFGQVGVASTQTLSLTVSNIGDEPLDVTNLAFETGTSTELSVAGPLSFTIAQGSSVLLVVSYSPTDEGPDIGVLLIESSDAGRPVVRVDVSGSGVAPGLPSPDIRVGPPLLFSNVTIGVSRRLTATIQNVGEISLEVISITFGANTSTEFSLPVEFPAFQLVSGATAPIDIDYTPVDEGSDLGVLEILSDDPDTPLASIPLSGAGVPPGTPQIQVSNPDVRFLNTEVGSTRLRLVAISNLGNGGLDVRVLLGEGTSPAFAILSEPTELLVAPGASLLVQLGFSPADPGLHTGSLVVESNDAEKPRVVVPLSGTGVVLPRREIEVTPNFVSFGATFTGFESSPRVFLIKSVGTVPLTVSRVVRGPDSSEFSVTERTEPITLDPGQRLEITVTYRPIDEGADVGSVLVESDDLDEPQVVVTLLGIGSGEASPQVAVLPLYADFGETESGSSSTVEFQVDNVGSDQMAVQRIYLGEGTSGDFSLPEILGQATVNPGETLRLTVNFSPLDQGADSGTVRVETDDPDNPLVTISLLGRGTPSAVRPSDPDWDGGPRFVRGDSNEDGGVDISDAVYILGWLFLGRELGCPAAMNANGDEAVDLSDPVWLLNHLFLGGLPPVAPYPECGPGMLPSDRAMCETPRANCH